MSDPAPSDTAVVVNPPPANGNGPWWMQLVKIVAAVPWVGFVIGAGWLLMQNERIAKDHDLVVERVSKSHIDNEKERQKTAVEELRSLRAENMMSHDRTSSTIKVGQDRIIQIQERTTDKLIDANTRNTDRILQELRSFKDRPDGIEGTALCPYCGKPVVP